MLRSLAISRRGVMEIGDVLDDRNQCMNRGDREIDYQVEIEVEPDSLDGQGFIIDRHKIHAYFQRKYGGRVDYLPSCEVMAKTACEELAALIGPKCQKIIANVGGAGALWQRPS